MVEKIKTVNLIVVNNDEDKILLFRRAKGDIDGGKFSFVGGSVENGESFEDALTREVKEETNCTIRDNIIFFKEYELEKVRAKYYVGEILGEIELELSELSESKWFDINDDLLNIKLAFNQSEVMKDFLDFLK